MPDFSRNGNVRRAGLSEANSGRDRASRADASRAMEMAATQDARAEVQQSMRAIAPDRIFVATCHVCQHPYRDFIEVMLVRGATYKGISERVSPPVDRRSISNHYKKHMDLQDTAFRRILEEEAKIQGEDFEEGVRDALTKRAALEIAMRKAYDDIINGVTTVEPRDLIQIVKVLGEMDSNQHQVGLDELRAQVQIFIQAIKDVCDQDTQNAIANRVKQLRQRENISGAMEAVMQAPPQQIPEAVVVED